MFHHITSLLRRKHDDGVFIFVKIAEHNGTWYASLVDPKSPNEAYSNVDIAAPTFTSAIVALDERCEVVR